MINNDTDSRLSTHEEVCAIRYEQINVKRPVEYDYGYLLPQNWSQLGNVEKDFA